VQSEWLISMFCAESAIGQIALDRDRITLVGVVARSFEGDVSAHPF